MQVMELLARDIRALDILSPAAFHNAFAVDMALGGSTNSVLHLLAIAHEAGVEIPLHELNEHSDRTPHLCRMSPAAGGHHIEDLDRAGGIPAVMGCAGSVRMLNTEPLMENSSAMWKNSWPVLSGRHPHGDRKSVV